MDLLFLTDSKDDTLEQSGHPGLAGRDHPFEERRSRRVRQVFERRRIRAPQERRLRRNLR